jgi:hypothetical protein
MPGEKKDEKGRAYLGIMFECCGVYSRIYKNRAGNAYVGWCPRCMRKLELKCGHGGTDQRIFRAQ